MPIFEFECQTCGTPFEELLRSSSIVEVSCPDCGSPQVRKKISTIAARTSGKNSFSFGASSAGSSCATGST